MIEAYKIAKQYADTVNVKIYNTNLEGKLKVFPYKDINFILGE